MQSAAFFYERNKRDKATPRAYLLLILRHYL